MDLAIGSFGLLIRSDYTKLPANVDVGRFAGGQSQNTLEKRTLNTIMSAITGLKKAESFSALLD